MKRLILPLAGMAALAGASCTVEFPFDPSGLGGGFGNFVDDVGRRVDDALNDPLGVKPFPLIVGGDGQRVFYATNLTDSRINFPGKTNDFVLPGVVGPSNLYEYANKKRELVRPLIFSGAFGAVATDGEFIAYISATRKADVYEPRALVTGRVDGLPDRILFEADAGVGESIDAATMALDAGRVAFNIYYAGTTDELVRVEDLRGSEPAREFEVTRVATIRLRGDRLATVETLEGPSARITLHDLTADTSTVVADDIRVEFSGVQIRMFLTANLVVWSEPGSGGSSTVRAYDIATGQTRAWAESVVGALSGATDTAFVTQEYDLRLPEAPDRFIVRRYRADASEKKLATFRADGLAGQLTVLGDRAAWVNPERRIVLAPLEGGDRTIFRPF